MWTDLIFLLMINTRCCEGHCLGFVYRGPLNFFFCSTSFHYFHFFQTSKLITHATLMELCGEQKKCKNYETRFIIQIPLLGQRLPR